MKKYIAITALSLPLVLLSHLVGCSSGSNSSDDLSTSAPNSTENNSNSNDTSSNADASLLGNSTSTVENVQPDGEPTFLTAPDGTPIYTSEISEIYKGSEERGNKEAITLEQAEQLAHEGGDFTVKCDGFFYGYIPEKALNHVDDSEMFKVKGSGYEFLGEKFDVNTGDGKCSTEYFRINIGDKFCSLTVKNAYTIFGDNPQLGSFSDVHGAYILDCCVEFDGEIEMTGYVNITPTDTLYGEGGDMTFYPDGVSSVMIPDFSFVINEKTGMICHFAVSQFVGFFGECTYDIGNMYKVDCDTSGLQPGDSFVKVKVVLDNIKYVPGQLPGGYRVELKSIEVM